MVAIIEAGAVIMKIHFGIDRKQNPLIKNNKREK